jgi:hypothetical protein
VAGERKPLFFFDGRLLNVGTTPEQQELMNELVGASVALAVFCPLERTGGTRARSWPNKRSEKPRPSFQDLLERIEAADQAAGSRKTSKAGRGRGRPGPTDRGA